MGNKSKTVLLLACSVAIFVPIWGTFHGLLGIKTAWAAFASAALFFAAGHELKSAPKVAAGHLLGLVWGITMLTVLSLPQTQHFNPIAAAFATLLGLGVLAVIVTHLGADLLSHLPSLFSGWAVAVGALGPVPPSAWGRLPLDVLLALLVGVLVLGIGISQLHLLFMRLFKVESEEVPAESIPVPPQTVKPQTEMRMEKYLSVYRSGDGPVDAVSGTSSYSGLEDIKQDLAAIKSSLIQFPASRMGGGAAAPAMDVPVKIVGVCGSPHKKGSTIEYLKHALRAAEAEGNVTTHLIELAGKDIKPCLGCKTDKCFEKCRINDAMQEFYPILEDCDGIIFGSPSYFGTFSGQLKLFFDRLRVMRHTDFQLRNKVIAPLAVAGRRHGGQEITNLDIIQTMMRHNTIIVNDGTAVCQLGATGWSHTFDDPNSKAEDDKYGLETAEGVGKRVAEVAKVVKASGLQQTTYKYNAKIGKR
ncbi:MAG: NAD(P)H-dependent oxidoreductase [Solirubrobacterales bacterium]